MKTQSILREVSERVLDRTGIQSSLEPNERVGDLYCWTRGDRTVKLNIYGGHFMVEGPGAPGVLFDSQRLADSPNAVENGASNIVARFGF